MNNESGYYFWLGKEGEQFDITKNGNRLAPCCSYEKDFPKDETIEADDVGNVDDNDLDGVKRTLGIGIDVV